MAKAMIDDLDKYDGKTGFKPYPVGTYEMEIAKAGYEFKNEQHVFSFDFYVLAGPDFESGKSTEGKTIKFWVRVPTASHPKFSEGWKSMQSNFLVAICNAVGYKIIKNNVDTAKLEGRALLVDLGVREGKDKEGVPRDENTFNNFRPSESNVEA